MIITNLQWWQWITGFAAAWSVGFAKTGIPGISVLAVPLMALTVGNAKASVPVLLPLLILADVFAVKRYYSSAQWNRIFPLFLPLSAGIAMGAMIINNLSESSFKAFIGTLIIVMLVVHWWQEKKENQKIPDGIFAIMLFGTVAGIASTAANAGGPVMILYLIAMKMPKEKFMGTATCFFAILNLIKVPVYGFQGLFSTDGLILDFVFLWPVVIGSQMGFAVFNRIPQKQFVRIITILTIATSIRLTVSGMHEMNLFN